MRIPNMLYRAGMKWSLKKLLVFFWAVSFLPCLFLAGSFVVSYQNGVDEKEKDYQEQLSRNVAQRIESALDEVRGGMNQLVNKQSVRSFLLNGISYRLEHLESMRDSISDFERYLPQVRNCFVALTPSSLLQGSNGKVLELSHYLQADSYIQSYYTKGKKEIEYHSISLPVKQGTEQIIAVLVPAPGEALALCFVDVTELLHKAELAEQMYVIRENQRRVAGITEHAELLQGNGVKIIGGRKYGLSTIAIDRLGWEITLASPCAGVVELMQGMQFPLLITFLFVAGGVFLVLSIYLCIITPIRDIAGQTLQAGMLGEQVVNRYESRSELNMLVSSINDYRQRTIQLAEEVNEERLMRMQSNVDRLQTMNLFLQAQINPHMLYNTLECICGMAVKANVFHIRNAALALSQLYRYCTQTSDATLEEEMESVEMFERIMNCREEKEFTLEWNIEEQFQSVHMPRMLLEPVVENAVKHGFRGGEREDNLIRISAAFHEQYLHVTVEDNGCGIPEEQLKTLQNDLQTNERPGEQLIHIGLQNVQSRIRCHFGAEYGLRVENCDGGGTRVTLVLGLQKKEIALDRISAEGLFKLQKSS